MEDKNTDDTVQIEPVNVSFEEKSSDPTKQ